MNLCVKQRVAYNILKIIPLQFYLSMLSYMTCLYLTAVPENVEQIFRAFISILYAIAKVNNV